MLKRLYFLLFIGTIFSNNSVFGQCGLLSGGTDETFTTSGACGPTTVTWRIAYDFNAPVDPSKVYIRFNWQDPATSRSTFLATQTGPLTYEATGTFSYPAGPVCVYEPFVALHYDLNGDGNIAPDACGSSIVQKTLTSWSDDNSNTGVLAINPVLEQVCYEDPTVGFQFQDATFPNCDISVEPDRPNQLTRWVQFIYGSGPGPYIPDVTIDTGGGTVTLTDGAGNLTAAAPFAGPIIEIPPLVLQANLNELTYPISHPAAGAANVGDVFEVTLRNWNICNPYDTLLFDGMPPTDPVNGDFPSITTTAEIEIIGPTPAVAGPDQGVCGNTTNLAGNTITNGTGTWNQLTGPGVLSITNQNNPTTAVDCGTDFGTYTLEWSSTFGTCASGRDTVEITFFEPPSTSNAGPDQDICGNSTTLAGNNPAVGTGEWFVVAGPGGTSFSNTLSRNSTFSGNFGTHTLEWRIDNGSCPDEVDQVLITFEEAPTAANAGPDDTTVCNDLTYVLQGNNPTVGTGTWTKISGPAGAVTFAPDANTFNATATFPQYTTGSQSYRLRWTISTGTGICPDETDVVRIRVFETPTVASVGPNFTLCGLTTNLNGNTATVGQGTWTRQFGPGTASFVDENDPTTSVTVSTSGFYRFRWTIENGNCAPTFAIVDVQFDPPPTTPNAGPDDSICNVLTYMLQGNNITNGDGGWIQSGGAPVVFAPDTTDRNATVTFPADGTYEFVWASFLPPACATLYDTVVIRVFQFPSPASIVTADPTSTCNLTGIPISAVSPAIGFGQWYQISGPGTLTIADSVNNNTTVDAPVSGTYEILWEVTNGNCSPPQRDTLTLILESPTPSVAGNDTSVCAAFDTLNANTPSVGTGTWSVIAQPGGGTFTFDDANKPNARFDLTNGVFGAYTLRWTISNAGCTDETDDVIVTFFDNPTPASVIADFQICADTAQLGAVTPTVGTGQWQLITGTGPVSYNPNANDPNAIVSVPPISDFEVYEFEWTTSNGVCLDSKDTLEVTFFEISTTPAAGADFEVCNTSTNLAGNAITVGTGQWNPVSGPGPITITTPASATTNINIPGFVNDSDTFLLEWTSVNGNCITLRDTVQVIFHDNPTVSAAGADIDICADTAQLNANTATVGLGTWSQVSGTGSVSFDNNNDPNTIVRAPVFAGDSGVYVLRWRISNGNCSNSDDNIQVVFYKDPTVATAGADDSVCALTYTLSGNFDAIGTGTWTQVTGPGTSSFVDENDFNTDVTVTQYGNYTFEWAIANGVCQTTRDTVAIRFDEFPSSASAGVDDTICALTYTLAGNLPAVGNGVWTVTSLPSGTATATFVDSSIFNTDVTVNEVGSYTFEWTISNGTCADSSDQVVIIFASSNTNTGVDGDTTLCINDNNKVYTVPFVAGTTYEWFIPAGVTTQFGGGINDNFVVLTFPNAGPFDLKVLPTNSFGCASDTQSSTVIVYDFPTRDAGPDWAICSGDTAFLGGSPTASGGSGFYNYSWSPTSGLDDATIANPIATPVFSRTYFLVVTDSLAGCASAVDTVDVIVNPSPSSNLVGLTPFICEEDTGILQIFFGTGTGPFAVGISDGVDTTIYPNLQNSDSIFVTPDSTLTYNVVYLFDSATSCTGTSFSGSPIINVRPLPVASLTSLDTVICEGDAANLNLNVSGPTPQIYTIEYAINGLDTTTVNLSGSSTVITVFPDSSSEYTLISVTDNFRGCRVDAPSARFTDSVFIQVDSLPRANIVGADTICVGDSAALVVNLTSGAGPYDITIQGFGTVNNYNSGDTIWAMPTSTTNYILTQASDTNGCSTTSTTLLTGNALIVVNPLPVANLIGANTICLGDSTPLQVNVTTGTNPFVVVLSNGDTINPYTNGNQHYVSPTVTTTYSLVSVLDSNGCYTSAPSSSLTGTPQITVNPLPSAQVASNDTICFGDDVILTFSFTGAAPYTFTFRDNTRMVDSTLTTSGTLTTRNVTVSPDSTTLYSIVSVQDANGCIDSINNPINPTFGDTVEIVVDSLPVATIVADLPTDTICDGDLAYLYVNVSTGPGPYTITVNNGVGTINNYNSGDTITVSPSVTTGYVITSLLDQNGCSVSAGHPNIDDTATIVVNPLPVANLTGTATICLGDTTPLSVAIAPGTNPFTVVINDGTQNDTILSYVSGTNIPVAPAVTTTYSLVSVLDSFGCYTSTPSANLTGTPQVTVNPLPTAQITQDDTICFGDNVTLSFSFTGSAPFVAIYKDNTTGIDDTVTTTGLSTSATAVVSPDTTTLYSMVSVQDANGCIDSINNPINPTFGDTVEIVVDSLPVATIVADLPTDTICDGDLAYLYVNVSTGPGPYTITVNNGVGTINNYNSGDTITVSPSVTTGYVITSLLDQNGCSVSAGHPNIDDTATIVVNPLPVANLTGTATICLGDTTPLSVAIAPGTNPFTVVINDGTQNDTILSYVSGTNIPVAPAVTTTYSLVSVLDSFGCYTSTPSANLTGTPQVTVNPLPTAQITQDDTICFGDNVTLSFSFTGSAPFVAIYKDNTTGIDDTVTTTGLSTSATAVVSPDTTTLYSMVSVQDANGCIDSINNPINPTFGDTVEIVVDSLPVATIVADLPTDTICDGDLAYLYVNVSTGPGPYTITVNNGVGTINNYNSGDTITVSPSVTTGYVITSLLDQNGCSVSAGHPNIDDTATIVVNPLPVANLTGTATICLGDTTPLSVAIAPGTNPFTVVINDGTQNDTILSYVSGTNIPVAPAVTTTYSLVSVLDSFGCYTSTPSANLTGTPQVTVNPLPTAQITQDDTICFGDNVTLSFSFTGSAPFVAIYKDNTTGIDDTVTTTGLSTSATAVVSPDTTTLYSMVSVQDANGCIDSINNPINPTFGDTVEIVVDSLPVATIVADLPTDTICDGDLAYLYVNVSTGPGPYTITVNNGVGTINNYNSGDTITVSPSVTTGYVITSLLDQNGCSVSAGHPNIDDTATIVVNPLPVANLTGTATICLGDTTPLSVAIAPGTNPFTVVINDGTQNDTILSYVSGTNIPVAPAVTTTYSLVSVLDSFGCYTSTPSANLTGTPQVTVNPLPTAQITQDDTICFGDNVTLSFSFTGSAPFVAIYKDNTTGIDDTVTTTGLSTSATAVVSPDTTTLYSMVSVQDANGCIDSINNPINPTFGDTVEIVVDSLPVATIVADLPTDTICDGDLAYLYVNVSTGPGPYTITVNNGVGTINNYNSGDTITVSPSVTTGYVITSLLDQNGCSVSAGHPNIDDTATIVVNPLPDVTLSIDTNRICLGDSTNLRVTLNVGASPLEFVVSPNLTDTITNFNPLTDSIIVSPNATTTYSIVYVTDGNGCSVVAPSANINGSPQLNINPLPTAQIASDDTICFGDDVILNFSFTGSTPFTFTFRDNTRNVDSTLSTVSNLTSRNVTVSPDSTTLYSIVSVQDGQGCIDSVNNPINPTFGDTVEIVVDSLPVATIVADLPTDTICNGDVAYLYVNITTGPGPYDLTINNGVGTINNYVSGDSIAVNPTTIGANNYVITSLLDQNGCSVSAGHPNINDTATIVVNPLPDVTLSIDTNRICLGDSTNLRVTLNVGASPLEFVVSPNLTDTITNFNPLTDSIIVSPNATTTYSIVYVTDGNGCSVVAPSANINGSPQLNINPLPTAQIASDDTICFGDDVILNFSFTGSTPFTFTFRDNTRNVDSTLSTVSNLTSRNVTVSPDSTTLYSIVSVQDGQGCIDSVNNPINPTFGDTVEIVVDSLPVATIVADLPTDTICNGDVAYLYVNITTGPGPYDLTINNGVGTINNYVSGDSIAVNPTTIGANNYVITSLLDQNGCSVSAGHPNINDTATIVVNPLPDVTLSIDTNRICFGDTTNLRVTLNVGSSPLEFVISPNVNDTITNFDPSTDFVPVSPNATTTYSINYVIDANGCQTVAPSANINGTPQLNINPLPTLQISDSTTICLEDPVILTFSMSGSAPYTFTYRDELTGTDSTITTIGGLTTRTVTEFPLDTTLYTLVSITDAQGCTDSVNNGPINPNFGDTILVNVNPLPITTLSVIEPTDTICFGDNALFTVDVTNLGDAPGPYTIEISGGIGIINNYNSGDTIVFAPNSTSNYNIVSIMDANGCSVLAGHPNLPDTVQVFVTPLPVVELLLDDNEICLGDSARLYWRIPVGSPRFDFVLNTDPNDTIQSVSVGDSIWVSPTDTTTYSIIYFSDSFGCTVTAPSSNISGTPTLIVNPLPDASISINKDTVCFGETTTITFSLNGPNDPYTYQIDTTGNILTGFNVINGTILSYVLGVGDHDFKLIEAIDDKGCVANIAPADSLVEVFVHALPTASISGDSSLCDMEPFVLNFNLTGNDPLDVYFTDGTNNYLRTLNTPSDTVVLTLPASVNPYFFKIDSVLDSNSPENCRATDITGLVTVQVFDRPVIEINSFDTTICQGDQAILSFDISGGRAPFEIDLSVDGLTIDTTLVNIADGSIFIVRPNDTTTYTILEIRESATTEACVGTLGVKSNFTVNVNPLPTANLTLIGPDTKCFGDSITINIQFTGKAPYDLSLLTNYAGPLSLNGIQTNDTTFNVSSSFPGFGNTISLFTLDDGHTPTCSVIQGDSQLTGSVTFNLNDLPTASLNPQGLTSICRGDSADLLVVISQGDLPYRVYISDGSTNYVDSIDITSGNTGTIAVSPQNTSTFQIDSVVDGSLPLSCRAQSISGSVLITVNDRPTVGISGIDTICAFENSSFQLQTAGTGPWLVTYTNGVDTLPTFVSSSPSTVSLFNPPVGLNVYSIVSISDNGTVPSCPADSLTNDSAYVFVNDLPTANLSGDTTICDGEPLPVYLDFGVTNGPFDVTISDGTNNYNFTGLSQQDTVLIPYPGPGFYIYRFTTVVDDNTNCEPLVTTGQAIVQVRPIPTVTLSVVGNTVICGVDSVGKFLQFNFDEPNIYDLILQRNGVNVDTLTGIGNGTILQAPGLQVGNNSYTIASSVYSTDPQCALNIVNNADIFVNADPTITIQDDDTICVGSSVTLNLSATGLANYSVQYIGNAGIQTVNSANANFSITVSPTITTSYRLLSITDGNGCSTNNILPSDSTEATIVVNQLPTASLKVDGFFSSNVTFCEEDTIALQYQLTGNGPFDVTVNDNLGNVYVRNNVSNLDTLLLVNPIPPVGATTQYFFTQVSDNNNPACVPTSLGSPVNITVEPLPSATISGDNTICDGYPSTLTFNFTGTGPWTFRYFDGTLVSATQATNVSTYTIDVFPSATTTYTIFDVVDQGTTNQCSIDSLHPNVSGSATVVVEPAVNADFVFNSDDVCGFPTVDFTDQTTPSQVYSYTWDFGDTLGTSIQQNPTYQFNNTTIFPIDYVVKMVATSPIGCVDSVEKVVRVRPEIVADVTPDVSSGCSPLDVVFNSNTIAAGYEWDFENNGTQLLPNNNSVTHTFTNTSLVPVVFDVYHVALNQYGCTDTLIIPITVNPKPQPSFNANPVQQNWPPSPVTFTNSTPNLNSNTYFWDFGDTASGTSNQVSPTYDFGTFGTFTVTMIATTQNGCIDSTTRLVTIFPSLPTADFVGETSGCVPFEYTFTNTSEFGISYKWVFSDGSEYFSENVTKTFFDPGIYDVKLITTGINDFKDSIERFAVVTGFTNPTANFFSRDSVFVGLNEINFSNESRNASEFFWDFGDGTTSDERSPTKNYNFEGQYDVTMVAINVVNDSISCRDTANKIIYVLPVGDIIVPNAFTPGEGGPNGGAVNPFDRFNNTVFYPVIRKEFVALKFEVFNRWGEPIFQSNTVNVGWDGYVNGSPAPQGVYIYRVQVEFADGSKETKVGDVTLLR